MGGHLEGCAWVAHGWICGFCWLAGRRSECMGGWMNGSNECIKDCINKTYKGAGETQF